CQRPYNVELEPTREPGVCDVCGGPLMQRPDDSEDVVRRRLEVYHESTAPLLKFYSERGLLREIDGTGTEEEVTRRAVQALGDVLRLDVGCIWEGYHGDSAVTVFVGGSPSELAEKLVRVTEESLEAGIAQLRAGARLSDVGHAVQQVAEGAGFSCVREYAGHGVGRALHEDPQVPNYGDPGRGPLIKPGLVVAIEPMVNVGDWRTRVLADDWTVVTRDGSISAHFEHTIAVTDEGTEVLTARPAA